MTHEEYKPKVNVLMPGVPHSDLNEKHELTPSKRAYHEANNPAYPGYTGLRTSKEPEPVEVAVGVTIEPTLPASKPAAPRKPRPSRAKKAVAPKPAPVAADTRVITVARVEPLPEEEHEAK